MRNTFDAESLGALETVLNDICRELASASATIGAGQRSISREQVARLILYHAQEGVSDPARLRSLVLNGIGGA